MRLRAKRYCDKGIVIASEKGIKAQMPRITFTTILTICLRPVKQW